MGFGLCAYIEQNLELRVAKRLCTDIYRNLDIGLVWGFHENFWRVRTLKREILDILGMDNELPVGGRLTVLLPFRQFVFIVIFTH